MRRLLVVAIGTAAPAWAARSEVDPVAGFFFANTKSDGTPDTVFLVTNDQKHFLPRARGPGP